jgi:mannose-6-phosphate isomerase-like protein (cupin superfamily)
VVRLALLALCGAVSASAQTGAVQAPPATPIDRQSEAQLAERAKVLMEQSRSAPSGNVSITLEKYPGHFTMLSTRVKSGGAEQHDYWNDIFVVLDGEATEMIGGSMIDKTTNTTTGESHGTRLEGAKGTPMHKGDVIHIVAGTPHQTVLEPGKTFTYYVIKVAVPGAPVK